MANERWQGCKETLQSMQLSVFGICLMLGLIVSAGILAGTTMAFRKYPDQVVGVTGAAAQQITSDAAEWQGTFSRRSASMTDAFAAVKQDQAVVQQFLIKAGVPKEAMTFSAVETNVLYEQTSNGMNTNTITGYELSQTVHINTRDVDKVAGVAERASELMSQGVFLTSEAPQFLYTKLDDLKVKMLGLATKNAYERARSMAESSGRHIGNLRSAYMGVFQITPENSTDVSDYGINDTSSRVKRVNAVVNATFEMQ
ncbi:MAG: SIMPL domain-containing protein [Candidatus Melainabacteria bacterium]